MSFPQRHSDIEVATDCIACDTAFAAWLMTQSADDLTPDALRKAWHTAWVEGLNHERFRHGKSFEERSAALAREGASNGRTVN